MTNGPPLPDFAQGPVGFGETLDINPATGSSSLIVPFPFARDRTGAAPPLNLAHSGGGNGPFGIGWSLTLPSVTRTGDQGAPRFDNTDRFSISGLGELSPYLEQSGSAWLSPNRRVGPNRIDRFRAVNGMDTHIIERWTNLTTGTSRWRVVDPDGRVSIFGETEASRLADPANASNIQSWFIDRSFDVNGNAMLYGYKREDYVGVQRKSTAEARRIDGTIPATSYLKRIQYGNRVPFDPENPDVDIEYRLKIVLDYGEHDITDPATAGGETTAWALRPDPFSTYAKFEARSYRRCRALLLFNLFPTLSAQAQLTDVFDFDYGDAALAVTGSRLRSITRTGHRADENWAAATAPLTFQYSEMRAALTPRALVGDDGTPFITASPVQWSDPFGEGVNHALLRRAGGWALRRNLGGGRFGPEQSVGDLPSATAAGRGVLGDVETDGARDLVVASPATSGFHRFDPSVWAWDEMQPFYQVARTGGLAPALMDCSGNGQTDQLLGHGDDVVLIESQGRTGDSMPERRTGLEDGPPALAASPSRGIFTANMTGSGLPDIVELRNGGVTYWPNLGHGAFGPATPMENAPRLDHSDHFDPLRIRFVDLTGTGVSDLIYLGPEQIEVWENLSGNGFRQGASLPALPLQHARSGAELIDLLADGTLCLVTISTLPGDGQDPVRYLPLMADGPAGRLVGYSNGIGAEVRLEYGSSATMYLESLSQGDRWHMPVASHPVVVTKIERKDHVTGMFTVERFVYSDAISDPETGGLATFGMTERTDTDAPVEGGGVIFATSEVASATVRTWFHAGVREDARMIARRAAQTFQGDPEASALSASDAALGNWSTAVSDLPTRQAALRALAGQSIRQETFGQGNVAAPFQVSESRFRVLPLQPVLTAPSTRRGAFMTLPVETRVSVYDQAVVDPRTEHTLHLSADRFGRTTSLAKVCYGRRGGRAIHPDQAMTLATVEVTETADLEGATAATLHARSDRALGLMLSRQRFEMTGIVIDADGYVSFETLAPQVAVALGAPLDFDVNVATVPTGPTLRRTEWERQFYQDIAGAPTTDRANVASPVRFDHAEVAAFPVSQVASTLPPEIDNARLGALGYRAANSYWWRQGARNTYLPVNEFGLIVRQTDAFGSHEMLEYDAEFRVLVAATNNIGLRTTIETDYATLEPRQRMDANGTIAQVRFDPLRRVRSRSVRGNTLQVDGTIVPTGDADLAGHDPRIGVTLASSIADPAAIVQQAGAAAIYHDRTWYDHVAGGGDPATAPPASVATFTRTRHAGDDATAPVEVVVSHIAGTGGSAQLKRRVDAGDAFQLSGAGAVSVVIAQDRWLTLGRQVPNNKGLTLRSFAPLQTDGPQFDPLALFDAVGRATTMHYDAMGRLSGSETSAGFMTEAVQSPWSITSFDENDTVERSRAMTSRIPAGDISDPATLAAIDAARAHADTPTIAHLDARGRPFLTETLGAAGASPQQMHTTYDALGRAQAITDARQFAANLGRATNDQIVNLRFVRDMEGIPLLEISVDGGTTRTLTDAAHNIVHVWDAAGVHLINTLDAGRRVIAVDVEGPGATPRRTLETHRYDGAGIADRNAIGRLTLSRDQAGEKRIPRYDHEGRPLETIRQFCESYRDALDWSVAQQLEAEQFTTLAQYDALGRLTFQGRADGSEQHSSYALGGAVDTVRVVAAGGLSDETFLVGTTTDARGDRVEERHGNGTTTKLSYEVDTGRLAQQTIQNGAGFLSDLRYAYDPVGNMTFRHNRTRDLIISNMPAVTAAQAPDRFTYDSHYRLVEATGWTHMAFGPTGSQGRSPGLTGGADRISLNDGQMLRQYRRRYRWDRAGNLEEMRHVSAAGNFTRAMWVDDTSNRSITRNGPDNQPRANPMAAFDGAGRLTAMDHLQDMRWNALGQLAAAVVISRPGQIDDAEYYVYGADGQRTRKIEERLDGGQRLVIETRYFAGCKITRRRRGSIDQFERRSSDAMLGSRTLGVVHHWTRDVLGREVDAAGVTAVRYAVSIAGGHVSLVLDGAGQTVAYEEYAPFGEATFVAGDNLRDLLPRQHRFATRERDDVTGLISFPFRYFAPWLARWISPDPLGIGDGPNMYAYAHDNPITYRDDLGLETEAERLEREWGELMSRAVDFNSLSPEDQDAARSGWLSASEQGVQVYVLDRSTSLHGFSDPGVYNDSVAAGTAIAIRTTTPSAAIITRIFDEVEAANPGLYSTDSPFSIENVPDPVPIGGNDPASEATTPVAPQTAPTTTPSTPATANTNEGNGPDIPPVSVSALARASQMIPGSPAVGAPAAHIPTELPADALRWGDSGDARRALLSQPEFQNGRVPRNFGLDGLNEIAPDRLQSLNNSAADAGRAPLNVEPLPSGVNPGQIDPHGPTNGQFGHVGQYSQMGSAETSRAADYLDQDNPLRSEILTEREHGAARGQLAEVARRPDGTTQYTNRGSSSHYHNDIAYWNEREAALNKTHGNRGGVGADNPTTGRMQAQTAAGGGHNATDVFVDARENAQRALRDTGSVVPPRSPDTAVYHQMSNFSGATPVDEVADFMSQVDDADFDRMMDAFDSPDSHSWAGFDAPSVPDVPNPGRGARALGAVKAGGRVALEALGPLGTGLSVYSFAAANTTEERILTGADLAADLIGYAGPVGASFSISYGVTRGVDEGIGWASREYLGRDLSPTNVISGGMVEVDQTISQIWADPSRPAYTQTIGWKLAGFFDSF